MIDKIELEADEQVVDSKVETGMVGAVGRRVRAEMGMEGGWWT